MRYDLVIFDLDGTLLDTLGDLAGAANRALSEAGFPGRSNEEVRRFIGDGAANLIRRSLPDGVPEDVCAAVLARFRVLYGEHVNDVTEPFKGIPELLAALKDAGIHAAINSNKPDSAVKLLSEAHFDGLIDLAVGERAGVPRKPAPDGALGIMNALGIKPEKTLSVGDGDADIRTAVNAGVDCAWVSWGYRLREELRGLGIPLAFDTVAELKDFLLS